MKSWLKGRPIDSDFWLLRAAASVITLISSLMLLIAVVILLIVLGSLFSDDLDLPSFGLTDAIQFLFLAVVGVAFGQLCHALADIASGLGRLNQHKPKR